MYHNKVVEGIGLDKLHNQGEEEVLDHKAVEDNMVAADILAAVDMAVVDKVAEDMVVVGREPAGGKVQHDVHMVVVGLAVCKVGVLLHLVHLLHNLEVVELLHMASGDMKVELVDPQIFEGLVGAH